MAFDTTTIPNPTANKTMKAGIVAIAQFTMKPTMLKNGMSISTTVTLEGTNFTHCSWPCG